MSNFLMDNNHMGNDGGTIIKRKDVVKRKIDTLRETIMI